MPNLTPPYLIPGDTIRIISTARKINDQELAPAIKVLREWGYKVELGANLLKVNHQFAGSTEERIEDLQNAINAEHVRCILCARGGYGTVKIIDEIDFSPLQDKPKWIAGFSDVTVLHNHLNSLGIKSLHSTMPILFNQKGGEFARATLQETLTGILNQQSFKPHPLNRIGNTSGELIGGNLSIINSLIGTASSLGTSGKILFIEDLDEYLYHIDRMITHLGRAGLLKNLKGLIIGGMSDMNDNLIPYGSTATEIIAKGCASYNFPIAFNFPAGHIPDNRALILGSEVSLKVMENESILSYC